MVAQMVCMTWFREPTLTKYMSKDGHGVQVVDLFSQFLVGLNSDMHYRAF